MAKRMPKHNTKRFFKKIRQNAIFTIWLFSPQIRFSIQADKGYRLVGRSLANTGRCDAWETIAFVAYPQLKSDQASSVLRKKCDDDDDVNLVLLFLQALVVNNNKLVSLPEEIGKMQTLMELDASCNEITHLPVQIGDLAGLKVLNLRRNHLQEIPIGDTSLLIS